MVKRVNLGEIGMYVEGVGEGVEQNGEGMEWVKEGVIGSVDAEVEGGDIVGKIIGGDKGGGILIELWGRWCGGCKKSMECMVGVKKNV